jgi:hypothetical protein
LPSGFFHMLPSTIGMCFSVSRHCCLKGLKHRHFVLALFSKTAQQLGELSNDAMHQKYASCRPKPGQEPLMLHLLSPLPYCLPIPIVLLTIVYKVLVTYCPRHIIVLIHLLFPHFCCSLPLLFPLCTALTQSSIYCTISPLYNSKLSLLPVYLNKDAFSHPFSPLPSVSLLSGTQSATLSKLVTSLG